MNERVVVELVIDSRAATAGSAEYARAMRESEAAFTQMKARETAHIQQTTQNWQLLGRDVPVSASAIERAWTRVEASMDPVLRKQLLLEREMARSMSVIDRAVTTGARTQEQADATLHRLRERQISDLERVRAAQASAATGQLTDHDRSINTGANDNFRRQNLSFQLQDVAVGLYSGQNISTVLIQQGSQIAGAYAGQGGAQAALQDFYSLAGTAARYLGPAVAAGVALYGAYRLISSFSAEAALKIDATTAALAAQAAPVSSVASSINELASLQKSYSDAIDATWRTQDAATERIVAATEREFNAKKSLLELELKRQEASIKAQQAEMAVAGLGLRKAVGGSVFTIDDGEARGFSDPRVGQFARNPNQDTLLERTRDVLEHNPLSDRITELRANLELTELGAEKLREALKATFSDRSLLPGGAHGGPASDGRIPVPTLRGVDDVPASVEFMDQLSRSTANRAAQLKAEAGALDLAGEAAASYRFVQEALNDATAKGIELSPAQIGAIKRQAGELARLADATAKATLGRDLQFERDQLLRSPDEQTIASRLRSAGRPVDLKSEEAGLIRANLQLEKQRDLWEDIRDTGMSAIDKLVGSASKGFTDIGDTFASIAEDITKQMLELGLANPLKNAIYGAGLPTLESAGSTAGALFTLNLARSTDA